MNAEATEDDDTRRAVHEAVLHLLDRHGVAEEDRIAAVEAATGLPYQPARRRLRGETEFTVREVVRLATHFNEPSHTFLGAFAHGDVGVPASLQIAKSPPIACQVWIAREEPTPNCAGPLAALRDASSGSWLVMPVEELGGRAAYRVLRLAHENLVPRRRIAVLDDDRDLAETLVQNLRTKGFEAMGYLSIDAAAQALQKATFDGFVLDWNVGGETVRNLVPQVRAGNPNAPIIILTGRMRDGSAAEDELSACVQAHRAQLLEKPISTLSLASSLAANISSTR